MIHQCSSAFSEQRYVIAVTFQWHRLDCIEMRANMAAIALDAFCCAQVFFTGKINHTILIVQMTNMTYLLPLTDIKNTQNLKAPEG